MHMRKRKNKVGREKLLTILLIIISVIFLFSVISDTPKNIIKSLLNGHIVSDLIASPDDKKKNALEETYRQIFQYEKKYDYAALYDYLTPTEKTLKTKEEFVQARRSNNDVYDTETISINNIIIHEDIGIVDGTISYCRIKNCADSDRITFRSKRRYSYIDGKWYHNSFDIVYCTRFEPYPMMPEFQRALSLIRERLENSQYATNTTFETEDRKDALNLMNIYNCLDIQYASNDDELNGAEGIFKFDNTSGTDDLKIFVSPRYQVKDDLLTATLLRHELVHASYHATGEDKNISCFENEAYAFSLEIAFFMGALNAEERQSINSRYYTSPEARNLIILTNSIINYRNYGDTLISEGALRYVKQSPFYQAQCANSR